MPPIVLMNRPTCDQHQVQTYNEKYDAYYCPICVRWLESDCDCLPEECQFKGRPEKPEAENGTN